VSHLRTHRDDHEIDLVVERDGGVLAIEVELTQVPTERDVQHLRWLEDPAGHRLAPVKPGKAPDGCGNGPAMTGPLPQPSAP
jgi:hypothetical protein